MKKNIVGLSIFLVIVFVSTVYFFINSSFGSASFINLKSLLSIEQKIFIKKYIFPYKFIDQQEYKINKLGKRIFEIEVKEKGDDINIIKSYVKLENNNILTKFQLLSGFYAGIYNIYPGSGYIDFHKNNIFLLSSRGILAFKKNITNGNIAFKQIKNNINKFIGLEQFQKSAWFSLKDLLIFNGNIFISYTEEIKEDCWNTSIIYGKINFENINFQKFFSSKECIHSKNNVDNEFNAHQSGGRIISFNDNEILLSIGDYRNRHLSQNKESVNGKIIKININNGEYETVSIGHRNPQGLYFDKKNNFILETEHGPMGGDEINIIEIDKINKKIMLNYGWAISSAGEHYGGKSIKNIDKYKKYPLHNSHNEYGFIEPLKSFTPSIGISEIVNIGKNKYVFSTLKDRSIYFFELGKFKQILNLKRVEVFERIRDLKFKDKKLFLFMEDTASIGVINID